MKCLILAAAWILVASTAQAQDVRGEFGQAKPHSAGGPQTFELKVVEFRLPKTDTREMSVAEILDVYEQAEDGHVEVVHTLHLMALSGHAIHVETEEEAAVTIEGTHGEEEVTKETKSQEKLGASAVASINWLTTSAVIDLIYDSSHVLAQARSDEPKDSPRRVAKLKVTTALVVEPGMTVVIGGGQGTFTSYLAVNLTKIP